MSKSPTWLIKRCAEGRHRDDTSLIPKGVRGVYVLLKDRPKMGACDVIYVGMVMCPQRWCHLLSHTFPLFALGVRSPERSQIPKGVLRRSLPISSPCPILNHINQQIAHPANEDSWAGWPVS